MFRILILFLVAGGGLMATACNTVRGVGQDLESAADAVDQET